MNYIVYMLNHKHEITQTNIDIKLIGFFDSESTAIKGIENAVVLPGFKDYAQGFIITKLILNKTHWEQGFFYPIGSRQLKDDLIFEDDLPISYLSLKKIFFLSHF